MTKLHELLKEKSEIHFLNEKERPLSLRLRIGEEEAGAIVFDTAMMNAELRSFGRTISIGRDPESRRAIAKEGEREIASCSGQGLGGMIVLTADSNILVLRGEGFWSASASLIEYGTGCWFLRFFPEDAGGRAPVKVEVSPVFVDSDDLPGLLALSVFMLLSAEAGFGR